MLWVGLGSGLRVGSGGEVASVGYFRKGVVSRGNHLQGVISQNAGPRLVK